MRTVPYYPVLGNHEKDAAHYYDFFHLPGNERYYTFSIGDALFLCLDSEGPYHLTPKFLDEEGREKFWAGQNRRYMEQQKAWVETTLELQQDAGFIFVAFHQPMYSAKASRVLGAALWRAFWGDLLERYDVQMVFCGHDHHYHHALSAGTHHVVTGGGGAGLYDADAPQPETVTTAKVAHYMRVDVGLEEATVTAIDVEGTVIEAFTVAKRE